MELIKANALSLCILIFFVAGNFLFCVGIGWTRFNYESYFSGYRCVPKETIFQIDDVSDSVTCGRICHLTNQCLSYVYQPNNNQCIGCRVYGAIWADHYAELPGSIYLASTCDQEYKRVCHFDHNTMLFLDVGTDTMDIGASLCTHIIYHYASIDNEDQNRIIIPTTTNDGKAKIEEMYQNVQDLKVSNPCLKTLIGVGGHEEASEDYSTMMESRQHREWFIESARSFLHTYGFNGLELQWVSKSEDVHNFVLLLKEMKQAFVDDGYLLTAQVPAEKRQINDTFDTQVFEDLDFIRVKTYDFHEFNYQTTRIHSPLYPSIQDQYWELNVNWAAQYWISKGVPKKKLMIGIATYGRAFELLNTGDNMIGAPALGPFPYKDYTNGLMPYYEICQMQEDYRDSGVERWDNVQRAPYYVFAGMWVGYDDVRSITEKMHWLKENGYGGVYMVTLYMDDYRKWCKSSKRPYPLLSVIYDLLTSG